MALSRRKFTREFKTAIRRLIWVPRRLHRWRKEIREYGVKAFAGMGVKRVEEERIAQLERKVGQHALEIRSK